MFPLVDVSFDQRLPTSNNMSRLSETREGSWTSGGLNLSIRQTFILKYDKTWRGRAHTCRRNELCLRAEVYKPVPRWTSEKDMYTLFVSKEPPITYNWDEGLALAAFTINYLPSSNVIFKKRIVLHIISNVQVLAYCLVTKICVVGQLLNNSHLAYAKLASGAFDMTQTWVTVISVTCQ